MTYTVRLSRNAEHAIRRLTHSDRARVIQRLEQIAAEPRGRAGKALTNAPGYHSSRVGDWRIIFSIDDDDQMIDIVDVGPRGEVYRRL